MSSQVLSSQALSAWVAFLRGHAALTRALNAQLVSDHGLTMNDYEVLLHLSHAPDCRLKRIELAQSVILTPSGITRLLDGLERSGWVEKKACDSDARVSYAALTKAGATKFEEASMSHRADIEELFGSNFSGAERKQLAELLGRLPLAETSPACSSE